MHAYQRNEDDPCYRDMIATDHVDLSFNNVVSLGFAFLFQRFRVGYFESFKAPHQKHFEARSIDEI